MSKRVRVNVRTAVNTSAVRRTERNGRDVIIVPSATLPDDVVMNNIMYPADEIAKSYMTLNRKPAPAGHPSINGAFVSASDPEGINLGWIGAWNENVRQEKMGDGRNRVLIDKVIDVERANETAKGRETLAAIENGDPIHTSTGLLCNLDAANGDVDYSHVARNMEFDHDAILLDEQGAATPEQGVGMLVNSAGEQEKIEVINSIYEDAERELDWAAESAVRAAEKLVKAPMMERIKSAMMEVFTDFYGRETSANKGDAEMADDKQLNELSAKVNALEEGQTKINEALGTISDSIGTLVKNQNEAAENAKAAAEAKKADFVNKVVEAKIDGMTEDVAKAMDEVALNAVLKMHEATNTKKAAPLAGGMFGIGNDDGSDVFNPLAGGAKQ
ncbi:hypothetical protein GCM10007385_35430 [Tateyamaria omphalii]|uniref:hypothetical protein n=1 Tax=Tateyamaria omphalii TaxID=299262 RepID=UPI0016720725|nr:hypothetical protein [Tateyamaria omphalii]GGX63212.1 hypothetical protein GCM10007385_35430 [Tateyamaria omphalii]